MKVLFWMFTGFDKHTTSEHLLRTIIEQLGDLSHSVNILQKDTGGNLPAIPNTLAQYSVTTNTIKFKPVKKSNFIARYIAELKYIKACRKYLTSDYDAVFIQSNSVAGFATWALRRKMPHAILTLNVQDIFPYNAVISGKLKKKGLVFKMLAMIQRYGYIHSNHIITISEDMKNLLTSDGIEASKIDVIYNWSYQDKMYENIDLAPVSHMFSKDFFNVVYAGNIGVMQNVEIIIEAARAMKNDPTIWFHIIGEGVNKENLKKKAKEYDIKNISFWPMQPPELAPLVYTSADVNVIPLVKDIYRTALPSKTATCLACQKPIVFLIGKDSMFAKKVHEVTGNEILDSDDINGFCQFIRRAKEKSIEIDNASFFMKNCLAKYNSKLYADLITN